MAKHVTITGPLQKMILTSPTEFKDYAENAFGGTLLSEIARGVAEEEGTEVLSINSHRMTYAIKRMANRGVIDMKPFFAHSKKAQKKEGGGWFLVVPIHQTTRKMISTLGRKTYDNIRDAFGNSFSQTMSIEGLFDVKNARQNTISPLDYRPTSTNVSRDARKQSNGKVVGGYTMFRTVSDKSAPSSWVLNKNNINDDNTSDRLKNDISALINKRLREMEKAVK